MGLKLEDFDCETGTAKENSSLNAAKESGREGCKVLYSGWVCSLLSVQTSEPPGLFNTLLLTARSCSHMSVLVISSKGAMQWL